jgi:hypothetical protein
MPVMEAPATTDITIAGDEAERVIELMLSSKRRSPLSSANSRTARAGQSSHPRPML